jgi:hypothetical protein
MYTQVNPKLIISLIKDDLINSKLVNSLSQIGLNASDYHLHLSNTIFKLMGFNNDQRSDQVFALYLELSKKAIQINISESPAALDDLALEIFQMLPKKIPCLVAGKQAS